MNTTLADLAAQEDVLMAEVAAVHGTMEEKVGALLQRGIFDQYTQIHRAYARLLTDPHDVFEALKRALFLQWYGVVEPACFTGIVGSGMFDASTALDEQTERLVLREVQTRIIDNTLDEELRWMLAWYYQIADYYFEQFAEFVVLNAYLQQNRMQLWASSVPDATTFIHRGQMGMYWLSVLGSHARHS